MTGPTVAITGMNAKPDNPGTGLAVARCLREAAGFDGRIVGLGYDVLDPGLYLREVCDAGYVIPYPSAGEQALLDRIGAIHAFDPIDILIPCLDAELLGFSRLQSEWRRMGMGCLLPDPDQIRKRGKDRLAPIARAAGLDYPRTEPVTHAGFFYECHRDGWTWPLVLKGIFYDAVVTHGPDEATAAFGRISQQWGLPVLVQEFVEGEEINLTAVGDGRGGLLSPVMMSKRALTDKGKAWAGVSIWDERLLEVAELLTQTLRWPGPLEVEVLRSRAGRYHLIEINPRFPAWIYLSQGVGRNLPQRLVELMQGEEPPADPPPVTGRMFVRYAQELIMDLDDFQAMTLYGGVMPNTTSSTTTTTKETGSEP